MADTSLRYAIEACNKGINLVMPVLDPISIVDNANIMIHHYNIFSRYFGVLGDGETAKNALAEHANAIREARNEISHFSRYGLTPEELNTCRRRCIYLLESIYDYLDDHNPSSPKQFL